ncbi:MAG: PEP-CTERM sorting domain-containing protein [Syntrophobacteraceae bacterium]
MKKVKRTLLVLGMVAALVGFVTPGAQATPVTGQITISTSNATYSDGILNSSLNSKNLTNGITSLSSTVVGGATGTFSSLNSQYVTLTNADFNWGVTNSAANLYNVPISLPDLSFQVGKVTYTFDFSNAVIDYMGSNNGTLSGDVSILETGHDVTDGTFSISLTGSGAAGNKTGSYGITIVSDVPVPEPATIVLLGAAMLALGIFGKKVLVSRG